jgi:uracil-DNA glycosylase
LDIVSKNNPVGILWGSHAKKYGGFFQKEMLITGIHPSPLSAYRGFFGSKPFSRANEALRLTARNEIDW